MIGVAELDVRQYMNFFRICLLFSAAISCCFADPSIPSEADVSRALKISEPGNLLVKKPIEHKELKGKVFWKATYSFSKPREFKVILSTIPKSRFLEKQLSSVFENPKQKYRKIDDADGTIIYQLLGANEPYGIFYTTVLINPHSEWDILLIVDLPSSKSNLQSPFDVTVEGIALAKLLNSQMQNAEQDAAANP